MAHELPRSFLRDEGSPDKYCSREGGNQVDALAYLRCSCGKEPDFTSRVSARGERSKQSGHERAAGANTPGVSERARFLKRFASRGPVDLYRNGPLRASEPHANPRGRVARRKIDTLTRQCGVPVQDKAAACALRGELPKPLTPAHPAQSQEANL